MQIEPQFVDFAPVGFAAFDRKQFFAILFDPHDQIGFAQNALECLAEIAEILISRSALLNFPRLDKKTSEK